MSHPPLPNNNCGHGLGARAAKRLENSTPFTPQPPALRCPATRSSPRFEAAELDDVKCSTKSKTLSQKLSLSSKKQMASAKAALEKQLQESSFSEDDNGDDDDDDDDDEKDQDLSQNLLSPTVPNGTDVLNPLHVMEQTQPGRRNKKHWRILRWKIRTRLHEWRA